MSSAVSHDFAPLYSEDEQLALEAGSFDPGRLWRSIRRHWLIVVVLPIVAAAAAYAYTSAQPDVFEAEAALIVQPTYAQAELGIDVRQASDPEREVANEAAIVEGAGIARIVDDELGTDVSYRAEVPDGTDIIVITAQAPTAEEAAAAANGIADFYLRARATQRAADLDETTGDLQEAIAAFEIELGEIDASSATAPDDQALAAQRDAVLAELTLTRTELESLRRQRATSDPGARIVSEAEVPDEPVAPNPTRTAVLVGLVTLAIGLAVAWFRARDPEPSSQPNPAVAPAPTLDAPSEDPDPAADTVGLWEEAGAPAFMVPIDASPHERAVLFGRIADDIIPEPHALLVAAADRNAGAAAAVATGLALALSQRPVKTLLVAAASDDPAIDHAFALGGQPGLSDLAHGIAAHRTIHPSAENRHLAILPRGTGPENTPALPAHQRAEAFGRLPGMAPMSIVLGPTIGSCEDADELVRKISTTVLVARSEADAASLEAAQRRVQSNGGSVAGVVFVIGADSLVGGTPELSAWSSG